MKMKIKFCSQDTNGDEVEIEFETTTWHTAVNKLYFFLLSSGYVLTHEDMAEYCTYLSQEQVDSINQLRGIGFPKHTWNETDPFLNEKRTGVNPNLNMSSSICDETPYRGPDYLD